MVLQAASMASNGRQAAEAKRLDFSALELFLSLFGDPLREAIQWVLQTIQDVRGDGKLVVRVEGLEEFDIDALATILANATKYLSMPGIPDTGRKYVLAKSTVAMMSGAPAGVVRTTLKEISTSKAPVAPPPINIPGVKTTGQPVNPDA